MKKHELCGLLLDLKTMNDKKTFSSIMASFTILFFKVIKDKKIVDMFLDILQIISDVRPEQIENLKKLYDYDSLKESE